MKEVNKNQIQRAFGQAAETYDQSAVLQHEIGRRLIDHYDLLNYQPKIILDLGCGTGFTSEKLRQRFKNIGTMVYPVDLSLKMVEKAAGICGTGICADIDQLPFADNSVDGIFANLSLHWSENLAKCFAEIKRVLKVGGLLLFSLPGPDTLQELRWSWQQVDQFAHTNLFWDLHDIGDALVACKFVDPVLEVDRLTLTYSKIEKIISDMRETGTYIINNSGRKSLLGKNKFKQMCENYEKLRQNGRLPVTYEIIFAHAWKMAEAPRIKHPEINEVHIPIADILKNKK